MIENDISFNHGVCLCTSLVAAGIVVAAGLGVSLRTGECSISSFAFVTGVQDVLLYLLDDSTRILKPQGVVRTIVVLASTTTFWSACSAAAVSPYACHGFSRVSKPAPVGADGLYSHHMSILHTTTPCMLPAIFMVAASAVAHP